MQFTHYRRYVHSQPTSYPRLPVPPLKQTLEGYIKSLEPFLADSITSNSPYDRELTKQKKLCDDFEHGIGATLQTRLQGINLLFEVGEISFLL